MAASHGARSESVKGIPWSIFSMFSLECRESPSRNEHSIASASIVPMVVFPDPETPITTMITADLDYSADMHLFRAAFRRPEFEGQNVPWPARSLLPCWSGSQTWQHAARLHWHSPWRCSHRCA